MNDLITWTVSSSIKDRHISPHRNTRTLKYHLLKSVCMVLSWAVLLVESHLILWVFDVIPIFLFYFKHRRIWSSKRLNNLPKVCQLMTELDIESIIYDVTQPYCLLLKLRVLKVLSLSDLGVHLLMWSLSIHSGLISKYVFFLF